MIGIQFKRGPRKKQYSTHGQVLLYREHHRAEIDRLRQIYGLFQAYVNVNTLTDATQYIQVKISFLTRSYSLSAVMNVQGHLQQLLHHPVNVTSLTPDEKLPDGWRPL